MNEGALATLPSIDASPGLRMPILTPEDVDGQSRLLLVCGSLGVCPIRIERYCQSSGAGLITFAGYFEVINNRDLLKSPGR